MVSRWRMQRARKPLWRMVLLLLFLGGFTAAGSPPAGASAPSVCPPYATRALAKDEIWGTPNPSGRNCTGFPIGQCLANQYGG
jgi:hypothetical protein